MGWGYRETKMTQENRLEEFLDGWDPFTETYRND